MSRLALEGVRVLDLSRLLPGGFCSLLLADVGADVVKVEDTGAGDYVRWSTPAFAGVEDSARGALFLALNRNKRSVRLNLKTTGGRDALLRLACDADVLLESCRPGRARSPRSRCSSSRRRWSPSSCGRARWC